jgi:hypothetical protein
MINQLSISQLEHKARIENNGLALIILEKMEEELEEAVENALTTNDADYSYDVFDAVQAVEFLIDCTWYKLDDTKQTKDKIIYMIETLHEDTSCYSNQVQLWKYKGCDSWTVEVKAGQYGESIERAKFEAKGFKEAQGLAVRQVIQWIRKGTELNV